VHEVSDNPFFDLSAAVEEYDDALRRLASSMPRSNEFQAVMNLCRLTGRALKALDRINQAAAGGGE
jgi:hypothetical protein